MGSPCILVTAGGAVSRESLGLADIQDYKLQASARPPAPAPAPAGAPQEQGHPLKELLKRLEAEVTQLREQVPLEQGLCCVREVQKGRRGALGLRVRGTLE